MRINPKATVKKLGDCRPGEFVRPKGWRGDRFALVAASENSDANRYLIFLNGLRDSSTPGYCRVAEQSALVLSFGIDYEFVYDHAAIDLGDELWNAPGTLRCNGSDWLMLVQSLEQVPRGIYRSYNVITGLISEKHADLPATGEDALTSAYCAQWEIRLKHDDPGRPAPPPLFKFPYKPPSK